MSSAGWPRSNGGSMPPRPPQPSPRPPLRHPDPRRVSLPARSWAFRLVGNLSHVGRPWRVVGGMLGTSLLLRPGGPSYPLRSDSSRILDGLPPMNLARPSVRLATAMAMAPALAIAAAESAGP